MSYRLIRPPRSLRRRQVKMDNLALVPASLLPFKQQWQQVANSLPHDGVLIVLPRSGSGRRLVYERVTTLLTNAGHRVTILPAERFT